MVKMVTIGQAEEVIYNRMPIGNFISLNSLGVVAIANESGDAEVRFFNTYKEAAEWLEK